MMAGAERLFDLQKNLEFNRQNWSTRATWVSVHQYGYKWGGGYQQSAGDTSRVVDEFLRPYVNRYDLNILELSPGAGRFTAELIRYAAGLDLLDMSQACLDICKERFQYYPLQLGLFANDGRSCEMLGSRTYDLIASFDSMVHMHPEIISGYVCQLSIHLRKGGVMWLDHSGRGAREIGNRTDMTAERMMEIGQSYGLAVIAQHFRNNNDCITVFGSKL